MSINKSFKKWLHNHDGGRHFVPSKGKQIENDKWFPFILEYFNQGAKTITINLKGISMRPFLESDRDKAILAPIGKVKVGDPVLAENFPGHFVQQQYLPGELLGHLMWEPQENAQEAKLKERMKLLWGEHKRY